MGYSKITSIELMNFMSYKKAKVHFDETGIVNIKGYNDSGKSAFLRGLAICLMDMFKSKQLKLIRHGEEYFRIVVNFDDGISIIRDKYANGQSLYEVYKDGSLQYTSKQGNRLTKLEGVPQPIQDYLGLCVTDSVYLNYQSCLDKLPVVDTTGSENYKMFHEVLRMEEIFVASNMINLDKNALKDEITKMESNLHVDEVLLDRCGDVSKELVGAIEILEEESKQTDKRYKHLEGIVETYNTLESLNSIPEVPKVNYNRLNKIANIRNLSNALGNMVALPSIEKVPVKRLKKVEDIKVIVDKLNTFVKIPNVPKVDETLINKRKKLNSITNILVSLEEVNSREKQIENKLSDLKSHLNNLVLEAKNRGIEFTKCDNCGSFTVVGGGHSHE